MDCNLQFWKSEGKTFSQRFHHWLDILDPLLLFKFREDIKESRSLLLSSGPDISMSLQNKKIKEAWKLSLGSVNPVTGDPVLSIFQVPAFLPLSAPLVLGVLLPHKSVGPAFQFQLVFHAYTSGFSMAHGNLIQDSKELSHMQILLSTGAVVYSTFIGTFPHYIMTRYQVGNPSMVTKVLQGSLLAILCAFNVSVVRSSEFMKGIEIMDNEGHVVGVSQNAGEKAVRETALSRILMIGTTAFIPDIIMHYLKRNIFLRNPNFLRSIITVAIFGLMIPASFSCFPQLGMIQRSLIEPEIISSTEETEFFYNRGL